MEYRKIQKTGGSSYIISLPKKWVVKSGLKEGDRVAIEEKDDGALIVMPEYKVDFHRTFTSTIELNERVSPGLLERLVISNYLAGYNVIRIVSRGKPLTLSQREMVRVGMRRLIGLELVEETSSELVFQVLLEYSDLPIDKVIRRIHVMTLSMQADAFSALKNRDLDMAKGVIDRDNEVDRLYLLAVKQLKDAVRNIYLRRRMHVSPRDCLGYRVVVKSLERIADHSVNIAANAVKLVKEGIEVPGEIMEVLEEANNLSARVHRRSVHSLFKKDVKMADECIEEARGVWALEEDLVKRIFKLNLPLNGALYTKSVMESIKRIAGYAADIAEIAINLGVGEPEWR